LAGGAKPRFEQLPRFAPLAMIRSWKFAPNVL
jgi:hypothetical protein